ncbi:hypothetical protein MBLNU457_6830t2 [Dothideomycetes sp. NU457]
MVDAVSIISVAYRVAQFTSSITRRIRTRTEAHPQPLEPTKIKDDFCSNWERYKHGEIDRYLRPRPFRSKAEPLTRDFTQHSHVADARFGGHITTEDTNLGEDAALETLLNRLKQPGECEHSALSYLAKHDKSYFKNGYQCNIRGRKQDELTDMLELVHATMQVCHERRDIMQRRGKLRSCEEACQSEDDIIFISNLMHALLCLEHDLLQEISDGIVKAIEKIWQDHHDHRDDVDWFSVFPPRARRPLSTTWPWTIKPSLAVLWGVCWMFYVLCLTLFEWGFDPEWNIVQLATGNILVRIGEYLMDGCRVLDLNGRKIANVDADGNFCMEVPESAMPWLCSPTASPVAPQATASAWPIFPHTQPQLRGGPDLDLAASDATEAYIATAAPDLDVRLRTSDWRPVGQNDARFDGDLRHEQPQPSRQHAHVTRLGQTLEDSAYIEQVPLSVYMLKQAQHESSENLDLGLSSTTFDPMMIDNSPTVGFRPINQEMNLNNLQPPSSPSTQRHENSLLDVEEDRSEGTSDSVDQAASPPAIIPTVDEKGQRICTFAGCTAPPFARPCEFKKHADRHQRPYVCKKPECARLKGFTYQGGLLRHEREIHQERPLFYCPEQKCKRHAQGFTRKENMEEHFRRIHSTRKGSTVSSDDKAKSEGNNTDTADLKKQDTSDSIEDKVGSKDNDAETADSKKRKRDSPNSVGAAEVDLEELLRENKRLKEENMLLKNKLAVKSEPREFT